MNARILDMRKPLKWPPYQERTQALTGAAPVPFVRMQQITKRFPGVVALSGVDFDIRPGEVHVLLGENGAGKSTLIKALSGCLTLDGGTIFIGGREVRITSPQQPLALGLRFIYQELSLIPQLDIARNLFLGIEPLAVPALGLVDRPALYARAAELLRTLRIPLDAHTLISDLSVTQQKMVEIARALVSKPRVIVMDEPTDVLEDQSRHELFGVIRRLKREQDVGFVYISHRYQEVFELGDRVTVLRDGRKVATHDIRDVTLDALIALMIGAPLQQQYPPLAAPQPDEALRVEHLSRRGVLHDLSFSLRRGEILAVTGLMGAGKTELARAIAGADRMDAGAIHVGGAPVRYTTPAGAIRHGIGFLTEDRKGEGLVLDHSIRDNYALPNIRRLSPWGLLQSRVMDAESLQYFQRLQIKAPGIAFPAGKLSGGNQQKLVIAKWLGARCKVLLFDEPTRGIDIKGRADVYQVMAQLLEHGVGIVMCTSDYAEALAMSHRVLVLGRGRVCRVFRRGEATEEDLLRAAIGVESPLQAATAGEQSLS